MKKLVSFARLRLLLLVPLSLFCKADTTIKIKTVFTDSHPRADVQNPMSNRKVYYHRGSFRREEGSAEESKPSIARIANCDTRTGLLLDLEAHEYRSYKVVRLWSEEDLAEYRKKNPNKFAPVESITIETDERKPFFGQNARHFKTKIKNENGEEILDGWYIDHESVDMDCSPDYVHKNPMYIFGTMLVQWPAFPEFQHSGPLPSGLAVRLTRTYREHGGRITTSETTVESISDSALDPSLFRVPSGFQENQQLLKPASH